MGSVLRHFHVSFLLLLVTGFSSAYAVTVKHHKVKGYDVYLINTHRGNGVMAAVNVMTGSEQDPLNLAGRAHLWEHTMFLGSKKFPGRHTFDQMSQSMGVEFNAYTAGNRTYYHGYVHPDGLKDWLTLLGSTFSEPDWNEEAFRDERDGPVKNEALSYQKQDIWAFNGSIPINLTAPGHLKAKYDVGTQEQIGAMTLDDMREYYYSNYQPGNVQIIVSGNMDALADGTVPMREAEVLKIIEDSFHAPVAPAGFQRITAPLSSIPFANLRSEEQIQNKSSQLIELKSTNENLRILNLTFQLDADWIRNHYGATETLFDYFRLESEGSLLYRLKEAGLVQSVSSQISHSNNQTTIDFTFVLTPKGAAERYEVPVALFEEMAKVRKFGIPESVLNYLIQTNVNSYTAHSGTPKSSAEHLARFFEQLPEAEKRSEAPGLKAFEFEKTYGHVTSVELQEALAKSINFSQMIGGYLGPDAKTDRPAPVFENPMGFVDTTPIIERWKSAYEKTEGLTESQIQLVTVPLPAEMAPIQATAPLPPRFIVAPGKIFQSTALLEENRSISEGGLELNVLLPISGAQTAVARSIFSKAFSDEFQAQLAYFNSLGISAGISFTTGGLSASANGNSLQSKAALTWLLEKFFQYEPSAAAIERAKQSLLQSVVLQEQKFPASVAMGEQSKLLSRKTNTNKQLKPFITKYDAADGLQRVKKSLSRGDFTLVASGNYSKSDVTDLFTDVRNYFPEPLTTSEREKHNGADVRIENPNVGYFYKRTAKDTGIGIVRTYQGPAMAELKTNPKLDAALEILGRSVGQAVFRLNRAERQLGYVHNAVYRQARSTSRFSFYGQVDDATKFPLIESGWNEIIGRLKDGSLSPDGFESEKQGFYRELTMLPNTSLESASGISTSYALYNDPQRTEVTAKVISSLTAEDIKAAGLAVFNQEKALTILHGAEQRDTELCSSALKADPWTTSVRDLRKKLEE